MDPNQTHKSVISPSVFSWRGFRILLGQHFVSQRRLALPEGFLGSVFGVIWVKSWSLDRIFFWYPLVIKHGLLDNPPWFCIIQKQIFAFKIQSRFGDFPAMFAVHVKDLRDAPDVFTSFKNQVPPRAPILPVRMVGYMGVPENLEGNPPHPLLNWSWSCCSTSILFEGYPLFADWPILTHINSSACGC